MPARGLLIGSYRHHGPATPTASDTASIANTNSHQDSAEGHLAFPSLSPLSSRPSTVSANHRYAPSLATEASLSYSEPESAAELAWSESGDQETVACVAGSRYSRQGLRGAQSRTGLSEAPCHPSSLPAGKAGLPRPQAGVVSSRAQSRHSAKVKPPATPPALKSARAAALPTKQHAGSPVGEEESRLLASLQRLDCQLKTTAHKGGSQGSEPELPQYAHQSNSCRVSSPAQHSRLPASLSSQQKPLQPHCAEQTNQGSQPPSTPDALAGPTASVAGKRHSRRVSGLTAVRAESQACPTNSATPRSGVRGGQARHMADRRAAAKLCSGSSTGISTTRAVSVGSSKADVSNSTEQQALQQSLAKLDARLTGLTARCTGRIPHLLHPGYDAIAELTRLQSQPLQLQSS